MEREMTMAQLEAYLRPLIRFGVIELKVTDHDLGGKKIEVYERDDYIIKDPETGEVLSNGDLICPYTIYADINGTINFINHTYGAFTKANKEEVIYVASLIGATIK